MSQYGFNLLVQGKNFGTDPSPRQLYDNLPEDSSLHLSFQSQELLSEILNEKGLRFSRFHGQLQSYRARNQELSSRSGSLPSASSASSTSRRVKPPVPTSNSSPDASKGSLTRRRGRSRSEKLPHSLSHCDGRNCPFHVGIVEHNLWRLNRPRPWNEVYQKNHRKEAVIGDETQRELDGTRNDIWMSRWKADQIIEKTTFSADFEYPRFIISSSKLPSPEGIIHKADNIFHLHYDFSTPSFDVILSFVQKSLHSYRAQCKIRSICFILTANQNCLYLFRGKAITTAKLKNSSDSELKKFWWDLSLLMSKNEPEKTFIHFVYISHEEGGLEPEFLAAMETSVQPYIVHCDAYNIKSTEDAQFLTDYFDPEKFAEWRTTVSV